jgi:hypothetical protein
MKAQLKDFLQKETKRTKAGFGTHPPSLGSYGATGELRKGQGIFDRINRMDRMKRNLAQRPQESAEKAGKRLEPRIKRISRMREERQTPISAEAPREGRPGWSL